ncbi:MAG: protein kinase [Candidatus Obscuribacterales bacterium]|nr:protein kinase [Candidatus Obscuribacterales bacterium]
MAEFELRMKHTNALTRSTVHAMAVTFPVWGIALPSLLVMFIVILLRLPANFPVPLSLLAIAVMTAVIVLCAVVAVICDDDEIRVSKDGLCFPLKFFPSLKFRAQRSWADLARLKLDWRRDQKLHKDDCVTLIFESGGFAKLQLKSLRQTELEQFFVAFEACALKCERDADLPDFEQAVQSRGANGYTFTQLWEKSLSDKFSCATFIPLEPKSSLQEGYYQILRQLSFGGFNALYLAQMKSGRVVVLKEACFPQTEELESAARERFSREAQILSKLNHPNIAGVQDYFVENGRHYMVLPHIQGCDLRQFVLQNGPQSAATVAIWAKQLLSAMVYLHEQTPPIVHGEVTPESVILKPDGNIVLIDFGSAKELAENFTGTVIGKQSYVAPEQFRGKASAKSDVYSFGACLYYWSTGKEPEPLSTPEPTAVHPAWREMLQRALDLDESTRADSKQLAELLEQLTSRGSLSGLVPQGIGTAPSAPGHANGVAGGGNE